MSKKGFTLIELLTVIAILGILVLLAAPKFLGYTEKANIAQIQNDIKVYEVAIELERMQNEGFIENWETVDKSDLENLRDSGSLFNKKGLVSQAENPEELNDEYYEIPSSFKAVNSKPKGSFVLSAGGEIFYYEGSSNGSEQGPLKYTVTFLNVDGSVISTEQVVKDQSVTPPSVDIHINNGTEEFNGWDKSLDNITEDTVIKAKYKSVYEWIEWPVGYTGLNGKTGYFKYVGTGQETVVIPDVIQDIPITSYYLMFFGADADVKKVVSNNTNVTDMNSMFNGSKSSSLDLTELNTSSVKNMDFMFYYSEAESLDLSSFDTSEVESMHSMFNVTRVTSLDLSSFDTSKVKSMENMFSDSKVISLDLSSFDTSAVANMTNMFNGSQATNGVARAQTDADRFNSSFNKPSGLNFVVKTSTQ